MQKSGDTKRKLTLRQTFDGTETTLQMLVGKNINVKSNELVVFQ